MSEGRPQERGRGGEGGVGHVCVRGVEAKGGMWTDNAQKVSLVSRCLPDFGVKNPSVGLGTRVGG